VSVHGNRCNAGTTQVNDSQPEGAQLLYCMRIAHTGQSHLGVYRYVAIVRFPSQQQDNADSSQRIVMKALHPKEMTKHYPLLHPTLALVQAVHCRGGSWWDASPAAAEELSSTS